MGTCKTEAERRKKQEDERRKYCDVEEADTSLEGGDSNRRGAKGEEGLKTEEEGRM